MINNMKKHLRICMDCGNTFETDNEFQKCCKPCISKILKEDNN